MGMRERRWDQGLAVKSGGLSDFMGERRGRGGVMTLPTMINDEWLVLTIPRVPEAAAGLVVGEEGDKPNLEVWNLMGPRAIKCREDNRLILRGQAGWEHRFGCVGGAGLAGWGRWRS